MGNIQSVYMSLEREVSESANNRKLDLLYKAARVFAEKGYQVVTVQEIADDMSLSKGGLYWHFKSKEELYIKVCEVNCTSSIVAIKSILDLPVISWEIVYRGHENLLAAYLNDPLQVSLILDFYAESKRVPAIHEKLLHLSEQRESLICLVFERMIRENLIHPMEDIRINARLLSNQLIGILFKYNILQNKEECLREFAYIFKLIVEKK